MKVKDRIAETLARKGGKIKGKESSLSERVRIDERVRKATGSGKPRSWKPVCRNDNAVKISGYVRHGTKDGQLAKVSVGSHCRNPPVR